MFDPCKEIRAHDAPLLMKTPRFVLLFTLLVICSAGHAAPGDLDPTFGGGGTVTTPYLMYTGRSTYTDARVYAGVLVQPDGKILLGGYAFTPNVDDFALMRYNTDGTVDTTFSGGTVTTNFNPGGYSYDEAWCMALQGDGKVVLAGYTVVPVTNNFVFALARYTASGAPDTSFNGTGTVTTAVNAAGHDIATGVAMQADGKIVVAGNSWTTSSGNPVFALVRYNGDGTLDTTFNGSGIVTTSIGGSDDEAWCIALQGDGKIVVAGSSADSVTGNYAFAVARYNGDGTLDTTFNGTGKVTTSLGANLYCTGRSVAIQRDGKILVAGDTANGSFAVVRYNADGTLDATFNGTGKVTSAISTSATAQSIAVQANGKILVAGNSDSNNAGDQDFTLLRYNADGTLDSGFNGTGKVVTGFGADDEAFGVALQSDGKIVVAGYTGFQGFNGPQYQFAVARYLGDPPAPLAAWREQYFGTANNTGAAADSADPYHTGVPNLAAFAVFGPGQDPSRVTAGLLPQPQILGGNYGITFTQPAGVSGVNYGAEWCADFSSGTWTPVADTGTAPQHVFSVPIGGNTQLFLRLRVTEQ